MPGTALRIPKTEAVSLWQDGQCLIPRLRVARGIGERGIGLMFRRKIPEKCGAGYLFPRCRELHTFWMRFPLDMLWLDAEGVPVQRRENVPPGRIVRGPPEARHVLEVAAGTLPQTGGTPICIREAQELAKPPALG